MHEDALHMEVRKFLKRVGVTSQRQIEHAVLKAIETGCFQDSEALNIKMTLDLPGVESKHCIEDQIGLE